MKYEVNELVILVQEWAEDKGIHEGEWSPQFEKFQEEAEELMLELDLYDGQNVADSLKLELGDVIVTLIIGCMRLGIDFRECLELAYMKIKDRSGMVIGGQFIKSDDFEKYFLGEVSACSLDG